MTDGAYLRSGMAALSDLKSARWSELFGRLEKEQAEFLSHEARFRSAEYRWPRDPLHNWSRCWEYPYVYHQLSEFARAAPRGARVLDVGSGVTFFPFSAARLGLNVCCVDIDPVCGTDLARAAEHVPAAPGSVEFRLARELNYPFADGEADAVYCISVLEHIAQPRDAAAELARVLKPGGLLVLTIDVDLGGNAAIGVTDFRALMAILREKFDFKLPDATVHPADLIRTDNGPYPLEHPGPLSMLWFYAKQWLLKPLLLRRPLRWQWPLVAVMGMTLVRKS